MLGVSLVSALTLACVERRDDPEKLIGFESLEKSHYRYSKSEIPTEGDVLTVERSSDFTYVENFYDDGTAEVLGKVRYGIEPDGQFIPNDDEGRTSLDDKDDYWHDVRNGRIVFRRNDPIQHHEEQSNSSRSLKRVRVAYRIGDELVDDLDLSDEKNIELSTILDGPFHYGDVLRAGSIMLVGFERSANHFTFMRSSFTQLKPRMIVRLFHEDFETQESIDGYVVDIGNFYIMTEDGQKSIQMGSVTWQKH